MDIISQANRNSERMISNANKNSERMLKQADNNTKRILKQADKNTKLIGFNIKKEGRVRIDAKRRDEVYAKCHNKCHYPRCSVTLKSGMPMNIHHINMKNNDSRLKNLELLCANHHYLKHKKKFRKKYVSGDIIRGTRTTTRLITKEKNKELNKRKKAKEQTYNYGFRAKPIKFKETKIDTGFKFKNGKNIY